MHTAATGETIADGELQANTVYRVAERNPVIF